MSNEADGAVTGDGEQGQGLVPKLRFPEFREAGAWTRRKLGSHLQEHTGRVAASTEIPVYSSSRSGLTPQGEYFDGSNLQNSGEYSVVPDGYITFRHMSDDGIFKFNQNQTGGEIAVSKEYPVFTTLGISSPFLLNILNNSYDFRAFALSQKKGGTRTRLYLSVLRTWEPLLPPDEAEQQKIADCLSSLDAVIAAEGDRLAALRLHKKGLMQALFPAPGQTIPRLRFPEFQGAGEWEVKTIGSSSTCFSGGTPSSTNGKFYGGAIPFIRSAEIGDDRTELSLSHDGLAKSAAKMVAVGDVLLALYGANSGNAAIARIEGAINQAVLCIRHESDNRFLFQFLCARQPWIRQTYLQGGQGNISGDIVKSIPIPTPSPLEQSKIGSALSLIDVSIESQATRVGDLKLQKAALMQQLLPSPYEAPQVIGA